jgi:hypothetical protein
MERRANLAVEGRETRRETASSNRSEHARWREQRSEFLLE